MPVSVKRAAVVCAQRVKERRERGDFLGCARACEAPGHCRVCKHGGQRARVARRAVRGHELGTRVGDGPRVWPRQRPAQPVVLDKARRGDDDDLDGEP
jgi:hypothetical protein